MSESNYENQLRNMFANVNEWLKFAEAKNFGLLTLCSAFIFGITQIDFSENSKVEYVAKYIFVPFAVISIIIALISLFPFLTRMLKGEFEKSWINRFSNFLDKEDKFENIHFYGYIRDLEEGEFERKFLEKNISTEPFSGYEKDLVGQIIFNSRITWLKYQLFKIAAFLFGCGIILSVAIWIILLTFNKF